MRKLFVILLAVVVMASMGAAGCVRPAPSSPAPAGPPQAPEVTLQGVEVSHFEALADNFPKGYGPQRVGFFVLAGVFNIKNPNDYPVKLEKMRVTFALQGDSDTWFPLNTPIAYEGQWIPAGKTNQKRVEALFTTRTVKLSLLVAQRDKVKKLGTSWAELEKKWWEGISEFKFDVKVAGSAIFDSPYGGATSSFSAIYPKK